MKDLIAKLHSNAADQILATFSTLEMQLRGFAKSVYEKDLRIAELEAQIASASAPVVEQQPAGYIRKWAFDGEKPEKRLNANNRMAWPGKFKFLPVTQAKILPDDIPLYVAHQAADTEKLLEAILALRVDPPRNYDNAQISAFCLGAKVMSEAAADLAASTALQAPVREVPDVRPGIEAVVALIQKQCDDYHRKHGSQEPDTGVWNYPGDGNEWMCDREELLDEIRALLPAAPVQTEGE